MLNHQNSSALVGNRVGINTTEVCDLLRQNFSSIHPISVWMEEGFFDVQDLLDISCHWLQFKPIKKSLHFLFGTILAALFVIGLISNATALYIILSSKLRRNPANILLANLAISDLAIVVVIPIFVYNSFLQGPAIGGFGCKLYGFIGGLSGTSSICTMAAVSIERYLVISRALVQKTKRLWAYKMIIMIWVYSTIFASLPLFGIGKYVPEGCLTSCSFDYLSEDIGTRKFILLYFIGAWVCPLAVISFCYTSIFQAVYKCGKENPGRRSKLFCRGQRNISSYHSTATSASTSRNRRQIKRGINQPNVEVAVAKVLIKLVVVWVTAWTPYSIVSLLGISGHSYLLTPFNSMVPALFAKMAACVDPFIYSLNHPKVRREILRRMSLSLHTLDGHSTLPPNKVNSNLSGPVRSRQDAIVSQKSSACHPRVSSLAVSSLCRRKGKENSANSLTLSSKNARRAVSAGSRSLSAGSRSESITGLETNKSVTVEVDVHGQCRRLLAVPETYKTVRRSPSTSFAEFYRQSKKHLSLNANPSATHTTSV